MNTGCLVCKSTNRILETYVFRTILGQWFEVYLCSPCLHVTRMQMAGLSDAERHCQFLKVARALTVYSPFEPLGVD